LSFRSIKRVVEVECFGRDDCKSFWKCIYRSPKYNATDHCPHLSLEYLALAVVTPETLGRPVLRERGRSVMSYLLL
jgi:hypothetical protein